MARRLRLPGLRPLRGLAASFIESTYESCNAGLTRRLPAMLD